MNDEELTTIERGKCISRHAYRTDRGSSIY